MNNTTRSWASGALDFDTAEVMPRLEAGMQVRLIATRPFQHCRPADQVAGVVAQFRELDFDFIPVRDDDRVVGVFHAKEPHDPSLAILDVMKPLNEEQLLAGDAPMLNFIEKADQRPYCLILNGENLDSIVTLSDLQKLPVRPAIFLFITHLEMLLAKALRTHTSWPDNVHKVLAEQVQKRFKRKEKLKFAIDQVAVMTLEEKVSAAMSLGWFASPPGTEEPREIYALRNGVAHGDDFAPDPPTAQNVARTIRTIRGLIMQLERPAPQIARKNHLELTFRSNPARRKDA